MQAEQINSQSTHDQNWNRRTLSDLIEIFMEKRVRDYRGRNCGMVYDIIPSTPNGTPDTLRIIHNTLWGKVHRYQTSIYEVADVTTTTIRLGCGKEHLASVSDHDWDQQELEEYFPETRRVVPYQELPHYLIY